MSILTAKKHTGKKANAFGAFMLIIIVVVVFIGMFVMIKPFALMFSIFTDDTNFIGYTNESDCKGAMGNWDGSSCHQLSTQATSTLFTVRKMWLIAPLIFILGLIIWYFTVSSRDDPRFYRL